MNIDLVVGNFYHDDKFGVRELLSVDEPSGTVRYRLLASKQEREWGNDGWKTSLGGESSCLITSFKTWSRKMLTPTDGERLLLDLRAKKAKWSPTESAYLKHQATQSRETLMGKTSPTLRVEIDDQHLRAMRSLAKKELLTLMPDTHEAQFSAYGVAVLTNFLG